ncbi:MAG: hypothetical protein R3C12_05190 [Planctomycetaceae bacterium]|nr:hypothetical protein [Planctomycetaceae bacterium]
MDLIPYPPDWSRENSPEILEYWSKYSRHRWLHLLLFVRDEDRRLPWRITAVAGTLAMMLVLLLFLESFSSQPARKIARTPRELKETVPVLSTRAEIDAPIFEVSYPVEIADAPSWPAEPIAEKKPAPEPFVDPFDQFAPPREERPAASSVPPPSFTQYTRPAGHFDLQLSSVPTEFFEDFQYSERPRASTGLSHFPGEPPATLPTSLAWGKYRTHRDGDFEEPFLASWFDRGAAWSNETETRPGSRDSIPVDASAVFASSQGRVLLKKSCPPEAAENSSFRYTLTLINQGTLPVDYVRVYEEVGDPRAVIEVSPPAQKVDSQLVWTIVSLAAGESRVLQVTCRPRTRESVLAMNTTVEVLQTLAARTEIFVPDVVVSVTLPVEVEAGADFPVQIEIRNNSEKTFQPSDLRVQLLKGVHRRGERDLTTRVTVPGPGQSVTIPMSLTAELSGPVLLEAKLNLEETLTVPVTAHSVVGSSRQEKSNPDNPPQDTILQKTQSNRLAVMQR